MAEGKEITEAAGRMGIRDCWKERLFRHCPRGVRRYYFCRAGNCRKCVELVSVYSPKIRENAQITGQIPNGEKDKNGILTYEMLPFILTDCGGYFGRNPSGGRIYY